MKNFRKAMHKLEQVFGGTRKTGVIFRLGMYKDKKAERKAKDKLIESYRKEHEGESNLFIFSYHYSKCPASLVNTFSY